MKFSTEVVTVTFCQRFLLISVILTSEVVFSLAAKSRVFIKTAMGKKSR